MRPKTEVGSHLFNDDCQEVQIISISAIFMDGKDFYFATFKLYLRFSIDVCLSSYVWRIVYYILWKDNCVQISV